MKIFIKKEIYFEITFEEGSDRNLVTNAFDQTIDQPFRELVRKVKFNKTEINAMKELTGQQISIRCLDKVDFQKEINQNK